MFFHTPGESGEYLKWGGEKREVRKSTKEKKK
jgi:hypothetical protein